MSQTIFVILLTVVIVGYAICAPTDEAVTQQTKINSQKPNVKVKGFFGDIIKAPFDVAKGAVSIGKNVSKTAITVAENTAEKAVDISLLPIRMIFGKWQNVHLTQASPAKQADYQYVVRILLGNDESKKLCGGVIISRQHVLTAAHCFDGQDKNQKYYVLNSNSKKVIKVAEIIKHDCYDPESLFDDLALLKLEKEFDDAVDIITLPESAQYDAEKVGKGIVLGSDPKSRKLLYLDVSVVSLAECSEYFNNIYSHQLCVTNSKGNSCTAESGFPLIQTVENKKILVGIASYTSEDCDKAPTMYTRIDKYLNFIKKRITGEKFIARC